MKTYIFVPAKQLPTPPCVGCGEPSMRGRGYKLTRFCRRCRLLWWQHKHRGENNRKRDRQKTQRRAELQP